MFDSCLLAILLVHYPHVFCLCVQLERTGPWSSGNRRWHILEECLAFRSPRVWDPIQGCERYVSGYAPTHRAFFSGFPRFWHSIPWRKCWLLHERRRVRHFKRLGPCKLLFQPCRAPPDRSVVPDWNGLHFDSFRMTTLRKDPSPEFPP